MKINIILPDKQKPIPVLRELFKVSRDAVWPQDPPQLAFVPESEWVPEPNDILCINSPLPGYPAGSVAQLTTRQNSVSRLMRIFESIKYLGTIPELSCTFDEPLDVLKQLLDHGPVAWDMEWDSEQKPLCMSFTDSTLQTIVLSEKFIDNNLQELKELLETAEMIGHNLKSDALTWLKYSGGRVKHCFDTMLAHHLLNPSAQGQHGLKEVARYYLGASAWDINLDKVKNYRDFDPRRLMQYNAYDTLYTYLLYKMLEPCVKDIHAMSLNMRASKTLVEVEHNGLTIDVPRVLSKLLATNKKIEELAHPEVNFNSPKQVKEWFSKLGVELDSTSEGTLTDLVKTTDNQEIKDAVKRILDYRGEKKLSSTYLQPWLTTRSANDTVHTTYNLHGTKSGRLSSSKPLNLQNIPATGDMRAMFTAPDGWLFVNADYSQAELRTMSILSGDEIMQGFFQPGQGDYFDSITPLCFPDRFNTVEEFKEFKKAHPNEAKLFRRNVKVTVFGLSYGMQPGLLAHTLDVSYNYAESLINNYLAGLPRFAQWREEVKEALLVEGDSELLVTPYGRRFQVEQISQRNFGALTNSALSFLPQSTASDTCLTSLCNVQDTLDKRGMEAKIVGTVHDAIMLVCPPEEWSVLEHMVPTIMVKTAEKYLGNAVPFAAEIGAGPNWAHADGLEY